MLTVTIMGHVFECLQHTLPTVSVTVNKDGLVDTANLVSYGAGYSYPITSSVTVTRVKFLYSISRSHIECLKLIFPVTKYTCKGQTI